MLLLLSDRTNAQLVSLLTGSPGFLTLYFLQRVTVHIQTSSRESHVLDIFLVYQEFRLVGIRTAPCSCSTFASLRCKWMLYLLVQQRLNDLSPLRQNKKCSEAQTLGMTEKINYSELQFHHETLSRA